MIIHELLKLKQVNIVAYHFRIQTILETTLENVLKITLYTLLETY